MLAVQAAFAGELNKTDDALTAANALAITSFFIGKSLVKSWSGKSCSAS
jgi:hypothetical protein